MFVMDELDRKQAAQVEALDMRAWGGYRYNHARAARKKACAGASGRPRNGGEEPESSLSFRSRARKTPSSG